MQISLSSCLCVCSVVSESSWLKKIFLLKGNWPRKVMRGKFWNLGDYRRWQVWVGKGMSKTSRQQGGMAPHSSTFAWKIPWMEEPPRLQSMGSLESDTTSLSLFTFMHWRRKWQPTPVFLPGESQGWGSLVGCRLWGLTESDTTEAT